VSLLARDLWFSYWPGTPVLRGVSAIVKGGEVLFLLGPNGSGKTTLLRCLGGLLRPDRGRIEADGKDLAGLSPRERARLVSLVPQLHRPAFGYTVLELVVMGRAPHLGLLDRPGRADLEIARRALEEVGLGRLAHVPYPELSGGELRLALIARALAQEASYMLLDEPDAHLDPGNQQVILRLVRELAARGLGLVVTTHSPNSALAGADRVMLLRDGQGIATGPPAEALAPDKLRSAYGVEFVLLSGDGERALVPRLRARPASSSGLRERGRGSR
jgi:iron complex transport system ATP-binding protein